MFILPVSRDDYAGRPPYVFYGLVIANALLLVATYLLSSSETVFMRNGFIPAEPRVLNLFSSMFLHAGFWHFAGNMFFLWMFASRVENTFGHWMFGIVYLVCGLSAHGLHYVFNSASTVPCVGASGAISGIAGCYLVLFPKSRFDLEVYFGWIHVDTIHTRAFGAIGAWILEQTVLGLLTQAVRFSPVAFWAHVGGFASGGAATSIMLLIAPHLRRRGDQPFVVRAVVRGTVLGPGSKPVPGARFQLRDNSGEFRTAITSPAGRFDLGAVPPGIHPFTVFLGDREAAQGNILVRKSARFTVPIRIYIPTSIGDAAPAVHTQRAGQS